RPLVPRTRNGPSRGWDTKRFTWLLPSTRGASLPPGPGTPRSEHAVETRATAATRPASTSGCPVAKAWAAMPPMEWPATTASRASRCSSTAAMSSPRASMVTPSLPARDDPWPRWSYSTTRWPRSTSSRATGAQMRRSFVHPCTSTNVRLSSSPATVAEISPPSVVGTRTSVPSGMLSRVAASGSSAAAQRRPATTMPAAAPAAPAAPAANATLNRLDFCTSDPPGRHTGHPVREAGGRPPADVPPDAGFDTDRHHRLVPAHGGQDGVGHELGRMAALGEEVLHARDPGGRRLLTAEAGVADDRCVDHARADGRHAHAAAVPVGAQAAAESEHRRFGGAVAGLGRGRRVREARGDVDDVPAGPIDHRWAEGAAHVDGTHEVDGDDPGMSTPRAIRTPPPRARRARRQERPGRRTRSARRRSGGCAGGTST